MAITSGFFNSLNGDRTYNADQMSEYYRGIISDGVVANYNGKLQVLAGTGMNVNVQTGRAYIDSRWMESDAVETLAITAAHVTLNRYTAVVVELDMTNREMTLTTIDGTNAGTAVKPTITNTENVKYLVLAYIYVAAGTTAISQAMITDNRANTTNCGWVTGLIEQVDTSTLFAQWQAAYQNYYNEMTAQFNAWFESLTEELNVNTYIEQYTKFVQVTASDSKIIPLNMTGYTYESTDIIFVFLNGLCAAETYDWLLDTSASPPELHVNLVGSTNVTDDIDIRVLKSKIGFSTNS